MYLHTACSVRFYFDAFVVNPLC